MYEVEQWKQKPENAKDVEEIEKEFAPESWKTGGMDATTDGTSINE
jgi:hypothetical protein